jgi:uncharacterized membrane protein YbhN (UPF0104 family)
MRKIEWVLLALGLALFVVLIDRVGWSELSRQFRQIGWVFLLILGVSTGRYLARTRAWQRAFAGREDTPPFWQLFQVRLAGESLNYLTVAGPILGEPTKATLLRERLPVAVGLGGTLIEAGIYGLTSGLITLPGLILFLLRVTLDPGLQRAGWLVALLLAALLLFSWMMLRRRLHVLSAAVRWISRGPLGRRLERGRPHLEQLEDQLFLFYAGHTRAFRAVFLWDCLAQVFAVLEIYVILAALGVRVGLAELIIMEGMGKVIKAMFFFVPGRVGTDEAGMAFVFQALGYGWALGIGLGLVRRLRALVWTGAGLAFLSRHVLRRPA